MNKTLLHLDAHVLYTWIAFSFRFEGDVIIQHRILTFLARATAAASLSSNETESMLWEYWHCKQDLPSPLNMRFLNSQ